MNSIKDFTSRELQLMDIHALRNLARSIGVSSPTTKSKGNLITDITDIVSGKALPQYKNVNRGRPAKQAVNKLVLARAMSAFSDNIFEASSYAASPTEEYKVDGTLSGVVCLNANGSAEIKKLKFANSSTDVQISSQMVADYKLKENDVVSYNLTSKGATILAVNGKSFVSNTKILGDKKIKISAKNIAFVDLAQKKEQIISGLAGLGRVIYLPSSSAIIVKNPMVVTINNSTLTGIELINSFCASLDVALFYSSAGANVSLVADNFLSVISAIKQHEASEELEAEVLSKINTLAAANITFVGIIPSSLKNTFTSLGIAFDNID